MPDFLSKPHKSAIKRTAEEIEEMGITTHHSGGIEHTHTFFVDSGVLTAIKEVSSIAKQIQFIVAIVVAGWVVVAAMRVLEGVLKDGANS